MKNITFLLMPYGPWFIYEPYAREQWAMLQRITVEAHEPDKTKHVGKLREEAAEAKELEVAAAARGEKPYDMRDNIAVFDLSGPMTKHGSSFSEGGATARLRRLISAAAADPDVRGAVIRIDSPGGSVAGTDDLAREVAAFARKKPIYAYIEDMGASAAYWVASQCTKVYSNPTALVGSLGTFAVVYDSSRMVENAGVKVHVLSTGKYKGAGTPGAAITDEQLAQYQTTVDDLNEDFVSAVARGRSISKAKARELFDGSVDKGPKALAKGLVDSIGTEMFVFTDLRHAIYAKAEAHEDLRATFEAIASQEEPEIEALVVITQAEEAEDESEAAEDAQDATETATATEEAAPQTNSSEDSPHAGLTLAQETDALLADAQGLTTRTKALTGRLAKLKAERVEDSRDLGPKALGHIDHTCRELAALIGELQALRPHASGAREALAAAIAEAMTARAS